MAEEERLAEEKERTKNWKRWGPYLSERQWGTVREDYSHDANSWDYFPHEIARSRAYRWGEDGLMGITDRQGRLCQSLTLWNERDPILKERLYGVSALQGNHGEDVKECYYYLDSTPTHSYMKALYKYPQAEFPYEWIEDETRRRGIKDPEFELEDTGLFDRSKYWDVYAEYCKNTPNDILCRYTVYNRGPKKARLHVIPTLWYRNTWIWGREDEGCAMRPKIKQLSKTVVSCNHPTLGLYYWRVDCDDVEGSFKRLMITENETNYPALYGTENYTVYFKDAFQSYIIDGEVTALCSRDWGTKVGAHYVIDIPPHQHVEFKSRLYAEDETPEKGLRPEAFDPIFNKRIKECNEYYEKIIKNEDAREKQIARQAYAGMLWSKLFYHYNIKEWLTGDPEQIRPPRIRYKGKNKEWLHLTNMEVVAVPDKWEYPWYSSWGLAFEMVPFANVDMDFAQSQLILLLKEWYMHPNGQLPAYETSFDDVNPPIHAWAVLSVWRLTGPKGKRDNAFLARCFHKLILNFTWWMNRKDPEGRNIFCGGFLGIDNIGIFDRSRPLPTGGHLEQADGITWMAFYSMIMLDIVLILAEHEPMVYTDMACKFFEHFIAIVDAMNKMGIEHEGLWNSEDGFYYDHLRLDTEPVKEDPLNEEEDEEQWGLPKPCPSKPLKIRSQIGLVPLFSCLVIEDSSLDKMPEFKRKTEKILKNREDLANSISLLEPCDSKKTVPEEQLQEKKISITKSLSRKMTEPKQKRSDQSNESEKSKRDQDEDEEKDKKRDENDDDSENEQTKDEQEERRERKGTQDTIGSGVGKKEGKKGKKKEVKTEEEKKEKTQSVTTGGFLLAIPKKEQLISVLKYMLNEEEFLSPYGIRSLSKFHLENPFEMTVGEESYTVGYSAGESDSEIFGGNNNWRGPVWLCMNYLIIDVLKRYHYFYGEDFKVECPTGSEKMMTLYQVSVELSRRMANIFMADENGYRPCHGRSHLYAEDPHWKNLILFHEYFNGNNGKGCGASHHTGWSAVVASCLRTLVDHPLPPPPPPPPKKKKRRDTYEEEVEEEEDEYGDNDSDYDDYD